MRPGSHHSPETRAKISATMKGRKANPALRRKISERTKAGMAKAAVRQKIKDGLAEAYAPDRELAELTAAWDAARPEIRERFLGQILAPLIGSADQ